MTISFATVGDLAARLKRPVWSDPDERAQVEAFLEDASNDLRGEIGWQVYPAESVTVPASYDRAGRLVVAGLPPGALAEVVRNDDGTVSARYEVGYSQPPSELVRWTCVLAAQMLAEFADDETLGGAKPSSEALADWRISYSERQQMGELPIPDRVLQRLRSAYGTTVYVTS